MAKTSKETASQVMSMEGFEFRSEELGGYTAGFQASSMDADAAALFKGLPDDRCQTPHWGYVLKGKITFRFPDREETYEAGDAYYAPPGHTPVLHDGCELVEFSPTAELNQTLAQVARNLEAPASSA
jgi:hypothetical protein